MTVSIVKPYQRAAQPNNDLLRQSVVFDGGNRTILWLDPTGKIQKIPSCLKYLEDWEEAQIDQQSVVIELEGQRYVLGKLAQELGGRPVFEEDKCELAMYLVLAAIEPNPGQQSVRIEQLKLSVPDKRNQEHIAAAKSIEGTFEFRRNGQPIVASIRKVEAVDETRGAYELALKYGLYQSRSHINGVLDLGGGTGIGRLYSSNGTLIRQADVIVPGTKALASKIDAALLPSTGASQELSLIMDGIAEGTFEIGTSGISFEHLWEKCREQWIQEIRGKLRTAWFGYFNKIGEVLIIGGSAEVATSLEVATKGRFQVARYEKIANFSQVINLLGMELV